ncbi:hypothetical protein [Dongshaea marina]|uniref:hypothetical protein n=1 Tax=Dongshaea marina TaxID=2047966 RepID=UPI000D3E4340|nr:hypothetical protein [Dongshaea marina]
MVKLCEALSTRGIAVLFCLVVLVYVDPVLACPDCIHDSIINESALYRVRSLYSQWGLVLCLMMTGGLVFYRARYHGYSRGQLCVLAANGCVLSGVVSGIIYLMI